MNALRWPALRHVCGYAAPPLRFTQKRWAQVHDVRFLVTHHQSDRVADRYHEKLKQKAQSEGFSSVEELKANYQEKLNAQRRKATSQTSSIPDEQSQTSESAPSSSSAFSPPPAPPQPAAASSANADAIRSSTSSGIKTLSSFIDVEKTRALPQREIEYLWRLRHANNPQSLCAVIPHSTYKRIQATARKHPQFILPLPREEQGAEIHFMQWTFPSPTTATVIFTNLAEYKLRGEYAQPHTTVTHHLDMQEEKDLVLLEGSVMADRGISVDEGKWLLMCLQKFYGGEGEREERKRLLEQFSGGDEGFKIEQLLEEAEKIT